MTPEESFDKWLGDGSVKLDAGMDYWLRKAYRAAWDDAMKHTEAREQAAAKQMRDDCWEVVEMRDYPMGETVIREFCGHISKEIKSIPLPTHSLDRAVLEARMEEAKWWRNTTKVDLQYRIAELESELRKLEGK